MLSLLFLRFLLVVGALRLLLLVHGLVSADEADGLVPY